MTEGNSRVNTVRAVGTLDRQRSRRWGEDTTVTPVWNAVRGLERSAALQVRSPFDTPFQLPLRLDDLVAGRELLEIEPGTPLHVEGTLEWLQHEDPRYATGPTERGRRVIEVQFRPQQIRLATADDEPGCDVWLEGIVRRDARRYLHPDRRVPIAVVSLLVQVERTRRNSQARLIEPIEIQVAIPADHPDVPSLMRRGNHVAVEGMLERVVVPLRGDDPQVRRAVDALDERWTAQHDGQRVARIDERSYARQRQRLQQTVLTRVVAGYVRLIAGEPATLEEAQAMRETFQRQRRDDQQARAADSMPVSDAQMDKPATSVEVEPQGERSASGCQPRKARGAEDDHIP